MAVFAVDKALLALRPHPKRNLTTALAPSLSGGSRQHTDSYEQLASAAGIEYGAARLLQLQALDPWLPLEWPMQPGNSVIEVCGEWLFSEYGVSQGRRVTSGGQMQQGRSKE